MDELELERENRIKNLMWTVSGDYALDFKPDLAAFDRSGFVALYDGIKQGAFAKYFDREAFSLYTGEENLPAWHGSAFDDSCAALY